MIIPKDPKNAQALRDFFTEQRTQMCSLAQLLGEPWLSHFNAVKQQYDDVLSKLGTTDQVPAALDANCQLQSLYSLLVSSQSLCGMLSSQMNALKQTQATALNSAVEAAIVERVNSGDLVKKEDVEAKVQAAVTPAVESAVKAKTEAGELVTKDMHTQLCSAATAKGIETGRAEANTAIETEKKKQETIATRKTALQTASLPVPEKDIDAILSGTDEEFATRKATAEARIADLKTKGAYHSALAANVWLGDSEYKTFETLAVNVMKQAGGKAEPFAQGSGSAAPSSTHFAA